MLVHFEDSEEDEEQLSCEAHEVVGEINSNVELKKQC